MCHAHHQTCDFTSSCCTRCGMGDVQQLDNPDWLCIPKWPWWMMTIYPTVVGLFLGAILRGVP